MMTTTPSDSASPSSTLPAPVPWYAEGTTGDFSMSELFSFAQVLSNLDAFEDVSSVLYYFEKPWKWTDEHGRWVELGGPSEPDEDQAEYILDNGTTAADFAAWKAARDEDDAQMADEVEKTVAQVADEVEKTVAGLVGERRLWRANEKSITVDGESAGTLADFVSVNDTLTKEQVSALAALPVGGSVVIGRETVKRTK